jgi:hypothetical protein
VPQHELVRHVGGAFQHFTGLPSAGRPYRKTGGHPPGQPGHPDHEELVQVGREDGEEPYPFQERHLRIRGQLQHSLVEPEPALLTVEKTIF